MEEKKLWFVQIEIGDGEQEYMMGNHLFYGTWEDAEKFGQAKENEYRLDFDENNDYRIVNGHEVVGIDQVMSSGTDGYSNVDVMICMEKENKIKNELVYALENIIAWHRQNDNGEGNLFGRDYITAAIEAVRKAKGE